VHTVTRCASEVITAFVQQKLFIHALGTGRGGCAQREVAAQDINVVRREQQVRHDELCSLQQQQAFFSPASQPVAAERLQAVPHPPPLAIAYKNQC
jgi:hypothetical protein